MLCAFVLVGCFITVSLG